MQRLIKLLFVALILLPMTRARASLSEGDDWTAWGGPNRNFTVDPGLFKPDQPFELKVRWKKNLGLGYSAISVLDDMAVTMFSRCTTVRGGRAGKTASTGRLRRSFRLWIPAVIRERSAKNTRNEQTNVMQVTALTISSSIRTVS